MQKRNDKDCPSEGQGSPYAGGKNQGTDTHPDPSVAVYGQWHGVCKHGKHCKIRMALSKDFNGLDMVDRVILLREADQCLLGHCNNLILYAL